MDQIGKHLDIVYTCNNLFRQHKKTRVLLLKFALGPLPCWEGVAWLGGKTVVMGLPWVDPVASAQSTIGVGHFVARCWLFDDGLWGFTFWCVWFRGWRSEDAWIISMHRK